MSERRWGYSEAVVCGGVANHCLSMSPSIKKIDFDSREEISGLLDALKEDFPLSKQVREHSGLLTVELLLAIPID